VSNFLAPAVVTETLRHVLSEAAARAVPGTEVTLGRPQASTNGSDDPSVNLYPYQVTRNAGWMHADLPTRGGNGALTRRPQIALNIDYLISFRGPEPDLVPERLMGSCLSLLNARPILTHAAIEQAVGAVLSTDPNHALRDADLVEQVERVRLTALPLTLEELAKLWSVFFQVPYVLSVAYQASVVLIEEELDAPAPSLPVRERRIVVQPLPLVRVERIEVAGAPDRPIHGDDVVRVFGSGFDVERTAVHVAGEIVPATVVSGREITVDLSAVATLRAGILPLFVEHRVPQQAPHLRFESNVVPLTVAPRIESIAVTPGDDGGPAIVELEVFPPVAARQRVRLFLNERLDLDAPADRVPRAYAIDAEPPDAVSIRMPAVEPGTYLARVRIDGADSPLDIDADEDSDTFGRYVGPTIEVP
jgi:hypothetical protein